MVCTIRVQYKICVRYEHMYVCMYVAISLFKVMKVYLLFNLNVQYKGSQRVPVAVKIIHIGLTRAKTLADFLSNYTTSVEGYKLIRREANFLSTLHHDNLTKLCGVRTNPFMLLIELAPFGSLSTVLKQYHKAKDVLAPAVLQASVYQVNCIVGIATCSVYMCTSLELKLSYSKIL